LVFIFGYPHHTFYNRLKQHNGFEPMVLSRLSLLSLVFALVGCGAETEEYFCEYPGEGRNSQTVIVDYVRNSVARCPTHVKCKPSISADFVGDLVIFSTEDAEHQLNTQTGELIYGYYKYQCSRKYL
jgi:hypothetical protein